MFNYFENTNFSPKKYISKNRKRKFFGLFTKINIFIVNKTQKKIK